MSVGGIESSSGASAEGVPIMRAQQAVASAQMGMLADTLDMAMELNTMMLSSLQAGSATGVGGSVNTYA